MTLVLGGEMKDNPSWVEVNRIEPGPRYEILNGLHRLKKGVAGRFSNPLIVGYRYLPWDYPWPTSATYFLAEVVTKRFLKLFPYQTTRYLVQIEDPRHHSEVICRVYSEQVATEAKTMMGEVIENIHKLARIYIKHDFRSVA